MKNSNDYSTWELATDRFLLRPLARADLSETYRNWLKDSEVTATIEADEADAEPGRLESYLLSHQPPDVLLGVFCLATEEHIGNMSVRFAEKHKRATVHVMIGAKKFWGQRVVQEVRERVLDHLFDFFHIDKVEASCMSHNIPAIYNFNKQGWTHEGVRFESVLKNSKRVDLFLFGILKPKWESLKEHGAKHS
jgi:RimJ/RimL family protein N-acetyltransferase